MQKEDADGSTLDRVPPRTGERIAATSDLIRGEAPVAAYDAMYEEESAYDLHYSRSHYFPMYRATLEEIRRLGGHKVLEVGCGSGSFAQMLFERTKLDYHGFDFSVRAVEKAGDRTGRPADFRVANALAPQAYDRDFDTIACTEVLEHIEADRAVVENWRAGTKCVFSVPNFDFATHVRYFLTEDEVRARYGALIGIERVNKIPRALLRGRTMREHLRQLRWNRNDPKRLMAMLGYRTFDNLAGWFVVGGIRR